MIRKTVLRADGNYDVDKVSRDSGLEFGDEPSLAIQSQRDEADINNIVKNFGMTGQLPQVPQRAPIDLDFVDIFDYQTAQNAIVAADRAFMTLPAQVRSTFENDPGQFVDFASDPANVDQMRKWGLAVPKVEVTEPISPPGGVPENVAPA